jgi:nitrate reductase cytochrome c-type subunit
MNRKTSLLLSSFTFLLVFSAFSQDAEVEEREYPNREDNAKCFVCHGQQSFYETSQESGETIIRNMYPCLNIHSVEFYEANHWSFGCLDCHSFDYTDYPHLCESKFEYIPTCLDCHEGDEAVAQYNFERIAEEYEKSHHTQLTDTKYSCWSCHDPHGFRMEVRNEEVISHVVATDNAMCLKCHSGTTATDLLLGTGLEPLVATHEWLPETVNHFRHVRCLECHADLVDDVLVAHDILPADQAVNTCAECHSSDSRLLHSLYKYQIQEGRIKKGVLGSMITSDIYVIGANRNIFLNWISALIFGLVTLVIIAHALIRIIKK